MAKENEKPESDPVDVSQLSPGIRLILERIDAIDAGIKAISGNGSGSDEADVQVRSGVDAYNHGLCNDPDCEACVQAGTEVAKAARVALAQEWDEALLLAGGEPLRERVFVAIQTGLQMRQHRLAESARA